MLIAETCPRISEIAALARTSRKNYIYVNPILYKIMNRKHPSHKRNPLFWGSEMGVLGAVRLALRYGANLDTCCPQNAQRIPTKGRVVLPTVQMGSGIKEYWSSLHTAAIKGHVDIVNYLLDNGMSIDRWAKNICSCRAPSATTDGQPPHVTALHVAICNKMKDMALLLISRGASVLRTWWAQDLNGPLQPLVNARVTALHTAAAAGMTELFEPILAANPAMKINDRDWDGCTAVHWACKSTIPDRVIAALVRAGADVNIRAHNGCSPLHFACFVGNYRAALVLICFGADSNILLQGCSPLHWVLIPPTGISHGQWRADQDGERQALIERLLHLGADANLVIDTGDPQDAFDGHTPLTLAAGTGQPKAVLEALLDAGARIDGVGPGGCTALHCLLYREVARLEGFGEPQLTRHDVPTLVYLIERGSSLAARDDDGWNAPGFIVYYGQDIENDFSTTHMFGLLNVVLSAASYKELPQNFLDDITQDAFEGEDWELCGFLHCVWGGRLENEAQSQQVAFNFDHDAVMKMVNEGIEEDH